MWFRKQQTNVCLKETLSLLPLKELSGPRATFRRESPECDGERAGCAPVKRARGARQLGRTTGPDPRGASGLRFPVVSTAVALGLQAALVLQGPHRRSGLSSAVGPSSVRPARRPLHSLASGRIPQRFLTKRSRRTEKPSRGDSRAARPARCARPHCAGPSSPRTSARAAVRLIHRPRVSSSVADRHAPCVRGRYFWTVLFFCFEAKRTHRETVERATVDAPVGEF